MRGTSHTRAVLTRMSYNHTLRVEITRVCVEITVVISFVRVKITLCVEITLICV
jgi:hypothetical protein